MKPFFTWEQWKRSSCSQDKRIEAHHTFNKTSKAVQLKTLNIPYYLDKIAKSQEMKK